jgi:hypothetical protein
MIHLGSGFRLPYQLATVIATVVEMVVVIKILKKSSLTPIPIKAISVTGGTS